MGGISKFQGSKGANQYQQYGIIRYELPFDAWCLKCDRHMCKGLRFNAKKDKIGKYFSTTLYSFTMKCYSCSQQFVIKTDPEHRTYDFAEGLRKMEQDFVPEDGDSLLQTTSDEVKSALQNDPMFRLQHEKEGKLKADSRKTSLEKLIDLKDATSQYDIDANRALRRRLRDSKAQHQKELMAGEQFGLSIPLMEPSPEDTERAKEVAFKGRSANFKRSERVKFAAVMTESIFAGSSQASQLGKSDRNRLAISDGSEALKRRRINQAAQLQAAVGIKTKGMILSFIPSAGLGGVETALSVRPAFSQVADLPTNALGLVSAYESDDD